MSSTELLFDSFDKEYEQIGKLRFRRYRDLLGAELEEAEQAQRRSTQAVLAVMSLAKRVSEGKGLPFDQVLGELTSGQMANADWISEYADEAFVMIGSLPTQSVIDGEMITLFIRSRAEIEGPDGWRPMQDWDMAATRRLPGKFRTQVLEFIERERSGEAPDAPAKGKPRAKAAATPAS